jgi:formate/nitrite transporter
MDPFSIDAYRPEEIASRIQKLGVVKSNGDPWRVLALSLLAGAFIALGAALFTIVTHDASALGAGVLRLIGGLAFCLGLVLVVVAGAELFTGNNLIVMAYVDGQVTLKQLLNNWGLVYIGNFIGALGIMLLIYFSGHWQIANSAVGTHAVMIADAKVNLTWMEAFSRGVLCNILVCLAVWLCYAGRSVTDKVLAVIFPISAFVALGFEHSVANMFFIPAGLMAQTDVLIASTITVSASEHLTVSGFLWHNLIPVTLGNIVGGSVFVGLFYWFIYLRKPKE